MSLSDSHLTNEPIRTQTRKQNSPKLFPSPQDSNHQPINTQTVVNLPNKPKGKPLRERKRKNEKKESDRKQERKKDSQKEEEKVEDTTNVRQRA